jgi:ABC-2 type transport system permease protein
MGKLSSTLFVPYVAVLSARFRTLLQYRSAALAGLVTQLFWGAIRLMILAAFYAVATSEQPLSLPMVVSYIWLSQAFLFLLPWQVDSEITRMIRTGAVAYELVRPLNLYYYWFARTLAMKTAPTTLRCVPLIVISAGLLPLLGLGDWALRPPADSVAFILFLISLAAAVLLTTAITMIMHVVLVMTLSAEGLNRIMPAVVNLFSGLIIPLPLFPDWLQPLLENQPFRGLIDVPFRIYSGDIAPAAAIGDIQQQLIWGLLLVLLGHRLLHRTIRRLVVQGG